MKLNDLLLQTQRVSGTRKPITIINPEKYDEFFMWLKDADIRLWLKAVIAVCLSGGLRVTEVISLRKRDFDLDKGFFRLRVLKKKKKLKRTREVDGKEETYFLNTHAVHRDAKLHPIAIYIVREYLKFSGIGHHDRMFQTTRNSVYKQIKNLFGKHSCVHMLRHSHISWLLHIKKLQLMTAADIMEITPAKLVSYSHADTKTELNRLYGGN